MYIYTCAAHKSDFTLPARLHVNARMYISLQETVSKRIYSKERVKSVYESDRV